MSVLFYNLLFVAKSFVLNVIEPNVLEEAIQREPERWELYLKMHDEERMY